MDNTPDGLARRRALTQLVVAVALIFAPILYQMICRMHLTDYPTHNQAIIEMASERHLLLTHFLYHLIAGILWKLLALPLSSLFPDIIDQVNVAGVLAQLLIYEFLAVVIFLQLSAAAVQAATGRADESKIATTSQLAWRPLIVTTIALMIAGPALFLWHLDGSDYLGYVATNAYHNPTMPALKPFALLLFAYVSLTFVQSKQPANWAAPSAVAASAEEASPASSLSSRTIWIITAALVVLGALAKPSYNVCLLPAVLMYAAYRRVKGHRVDFALLGRGVFVPMFLMLAWQYLFTYKTGNSGVLFLPLAAMSVFSSYLIPKYFLSILFPLTVYVLYKPARRDPILTLAWWVFGVASFYTYLLAEAGRVGHGNFIWSGQIGLFVLFVQSMIFLVRETAIFAPSSLRSFFAADRRSMASDRRLMWCFLAFGAHFASGVYYYVHLMRLEGK